jgi:hypothetical protein
VALYSRMESSQVLIRHTLSLERDAMGPDTDEVIADADSAITAVTAMESTASDMTNPTWARSPAQITGGMTQRDLPVHALRLDNTRKRIRCLTRCLPSSSIREAACKTGCINCQRTNTMPFSRVTGYGRVCTSTSALSMA